MNKKVLVFMVSPLMLFCSWLVFFSTLLSVSSGTWSGVWVGMELNLFSFMVLMHGGGGFDLEPLIKYFVVQSVGSVVFIFSVVFTMFVFGGFSSFLMILGLFLKVGVFPFHSWVPSVVVKSRWAIGGLILSWQKLAPMVFLVFISNSVVVMSVMSMALLGAVGGLNQSSVRGMVSYSSFVHMSWMMVGLVFSFYVFLFYFFMYCVSLLLFFAGCSISGKSSLLNPALSPLGLLGLLMIMGVPPFLGFLGKLLVMLSSPNLIILICVLGSVISLKFYTSFLYSMFLNSSVSGVYTSSPTLVAGMSLNLLSLLVFMLFLLL